MHAVICLDLVGCLGEGTSLSEAVLLVEIGLGVLGVASVLVGVKGRVIGIGNWAANGGTLAQLRACPGLALNPLLRLRGLGVGHNRRPCGASPTREWAWFR